MPLQVFADTAYVVLGQVRKKYPSSGWFEFDSQPAVETLVLPVVEPVLVPEVAVSAVPVRPPRLKLSDVVPVVVRDWGAGSRVARVCGWRDRGRKL